MSETLLVAAKAFADLGIQMGAGSVVWYLRDQTLVIRATDTVANRCGGFLPGGSHEVKKRVREWTNSLDFDRFFDELNRGGDLRDAVRRGIDSFVEHSGFRRDRAETVLTELLQALRDGAYTSSSGNAVMMARHEQIAVEQHSRFDGQGKTLDEIKQTLGALSTPVRNAVAEYLEGSGDWLPLNRLLRKGAIGEAGQELTRRIEKLEQLSVDHPEVQPILREHYQDCLLKHAEILSHQGRTSEAVDNYEKAKALGFTKSEIRKVAFRVSLNLRRVDECDRLLQEGNLPDIKTAELDLLVVKEDWEEVAKRVAEDAAEFRPIYLRVLAQLERADGDESLDAVLLAELLDRAEELVGEHPVQKVQLALATIGLLDKIVREMLEAPGLNRGALVLAARARTDEALQACYDVGHESGYAAMLQQAFRLFSLLEDDERLRDIQQRTDATVAEPPSPLQFEEAYIQGRISTAQHLFFSADAMLENQDVIHFDRAEPMLWSALHVADDPELRVIIAQRLITIYIKRDSVEAAERVLGALSDIAEHDQLLLQTQIVHKPDNRVSAIEHLRNALVRFPRSLPLRRNLIDLLIAEIGRCAEADSPVSDLSVFVSEVDEHAEILQQILPTPKHDLAKGRARFATRDFSGAIRVLTPLASKSAGPLQAALLRTQALLELRRMDEAAAQLAELAQRTGDPAYAADASAHWLTANKRDEAIRLLREWIFKHPNDALLSVYLGMALICADDVTPDEGREAFNLLARARWHFPRQKSIYMWMSKAARIAGKQEVAQRYWLMAMPQQTSAAIRTKDDLATLPVVPEGEVGISVQFVGDDALRAFVEWNEERKDALQRLLKADVLSYRDLFGINGRAWDHWIQWTEAALEQFRDQGDVTAIRAPWPFTKSDLQDSRGLLLDLTALLTLSVLSDGECILRALDAAGRRPYVMSEDLDALNDAIAATADRMIVAVQLPYESLLKALKQYELLPIFAESDLKRFEDSVPESLRPQLGASAFDVGLAFSLGEAVYVSDRHDATNYEAEASANVIVTSASFLHSLVSHGIVGANSAERAESVDDRFRGWRGAPIVDLPENVVISAFALPYWFEAGLLTCNDEAWLRATSEWPRLHVGPFARHHIFEQAHEHRVKRRKAETAGNFQGVLRQLIREEVVEVLPSRERLGEVEGLDERFNHLWPRALGLVHTAHRQDLDIWTDDRVFGYLLWPYGHPLPIPQLRHDVQVIRSAYHGVELRLTEELLETLSARGELDEQEAENLGYELLQFGYRPLRFRLALAHLIRNFAYKTGSPRYKPFLDALRGLITAEWDKKSDAPTIDERGLKRLLFSSVLPDLVAFVWSTRSTRRIDERTALADDLIDLIVHEMRAYVGDVEDGMTGFWTSLLARLITPTDFAQGQLAIVPEKIGDSEAGEILQHALFWFTSAVIRHETGDRRRRAVRGIEDYLLQFLDYIQARILPIVSDESERTERMPTNDELRSRVVSTLIIHMRGFLYPFFNSELFFEFDPTLRRALGVLARVVGEFKAKVFFPWNDGAIRIGVEEDEEERFALRRIDEAIQGHPEAWRTIGGDLSLECTWERPIPEEDKAENIGLPEKHPVLVALSLVRLILRDDAHTLTSLFDVVLTQLQLIDPSLGQVLEKNRVEFGDKEEETRRWARERFALELIQSPYFELQRDLGHGIRRLRELDTSRLEQYLAPPAGWLSSADQNPFVVAVNKREWPLHALLDFLALTSTPSQLYERAANEAAEISTRPNSESDLRDYLSGLIHLVRFSHSPFQMVQALLIILISTSSRESREVPTISPDGTDWPSRDWFARFLGQVLRHTNNSLPSDGPETPAPWRPHHLKSVHAYVLRLAAHATNASQHVNSWKAENDDDVYVLRQWLHATLMLTGRLIPYLTGRYGHGMELQIAVEAATRDLGVPYDSPIYIQDRFNPFLLGPHLLDHEVAAVLHAIDAFIQHNPDPAKVLDLNQIRTLVVPWVSCKRSKADEIYIEQKEIAHDSFNLQMPLAPREAAATLLSRLDI